MDRDERGKHDITSVSSDTSEEQPRGAPMSGRDIAAFAFLALFFATLVFLADSGPSKPAPPPAPRATFFENSARYGHIPLSVTLGGGEYEISYETADTESIKRFGKGSKDVFFADFRTNQVRGDPETATTFIFYGDLRVHISEIDVNDFLKFSVTNFPRGLNAYFNYSHSERGPPGAFQNTKKMRVVIVGTVANLDLPNLNGYSRMKGRILDLEPDENVRAEYEKTVSQWHVLRSIKGGRPPDRPTGRR